MTNEHMPNVRVLPASAASLIMLSTVGALLRIEYSSMVQEPLPERIAGLVGQLGA